MVATWLVVSVGLAIPSDAATRSSLTRALRSAPAHKSGCCTDVETILYHFQWDPKTESAPYGAGPLAGVTLDPSGNGVIYGTTVHGGAYKHGVIFKLTPSGPGYEESVIFSFPKSIDWSLASAPVLVDTTGAIYSTTGANVANDCGTVFKLTPTGSTYAASTIHSFRKSSDGCDPALAGLYEDPSGALYGTTIGGGDSSCSNEPGQQNGCGTVFKLTPTGSGAYSESFVYRFVGGRDGKEPISGLIADSSGALYGTTGGGGELKCNCGVVYKLTPTGSGPYAMTVIHDFGVDASPGPLTADAAGDLYGTAIARRGGGNVVYELTPSASASTGYTYRLIYNASDGRPGEVILCSSGGALCAAAFFAGPVDAGDVFELNPPQDPSATYGETTLYTFEGGDTGANPSSYIVYSGGAIYGTFWANGGPSGSQNHRFEPFGGVFKIALPSSSSFLNGAEFGATS